MKEDLAIQISGLKKKYKLGAIGGGTLKGDIQSWWARKRGKVDPNSIIGTEDVKIGEEFYALNGIDLEVKKGEALGIIGMNGAGKSTLLKILSRVTAPSEGEVRIKGRITSMLEVGTGFHGELTGRENIYMNGAILGMTRKEVDEKIEEIIDFSECRDFIDTPVKRYSSGMYVKLGFAVAAHLDSEIMIMDEVLAVGDVRFQEKCLDKMHDAALHNGKTILYVSHNMNTIRQLCDRCIVLNKGKIIFVGDTEDAIQKYLGDQKRDSATIDTSESERIGNFIDHPVTVTEISVEDHEDSLFWYAEKIKIHMKYNSDKTYDDVMLRLMVHYADGSPITMITTNNTVCIKEGQSNELIFEMDLNHIVPGRYKLSFALYQLNKYSNDTFLDGLVDFMTMDIQANLEFNNGMEWRRTFWGSTKLDDMRVING